MTPRERTTDRPSRIPVSAKIAPEIAGLLQSLSDRIAELEGADRIAPDAVSGKGSPPFSHVEVQRLNTGIILDFYGSFTGPPLKVKSVRIPIEPQAVAGTAAAASVDIGGILTTIRLGAIEAHSHSASDVGNILFWTGNYF